MSSHSKKSSPNTYVVVSSYAGAELRLLGTFTDAAAIGPYLTANSSGNQAFDGGDVCSLGVGETCHTPFGAVTVHVTALRTDGRTKTIYVTPSGAAQTSKPKEGAPLILKCCPICVKWAEPADDDDHCSYECASGG
jgi:hypothetical protein